MRVGAVSPGKSVRSANGIADGGAGRGAPLARSGEVAKTAQGAEIIKTIQSGRCKAEALKTAQDKGSEITITTPVRGTEAVKTEASGSVQAGRGSKIVNAQARPLPAKSARIPAKNETAHQNGAKQRGLEDAPAPAFPRRRLTSSEVKQLVDRAMEKLKEERPADYALLYELYFNRVSIRALSRTLRIPRSTLRYRKRLALSRIKQIIETLQN